MPIKREEFLKAISREHHHGLLLCWKIKTGLKKHIDPIRIKRYVDWYYTTHLLPHFEVEEKYVYPILGAEHELYKRAYTEHKRLKSLFESNADVIETLASIEKELDDHIRFEERIMFNEIQAKATNEQLQNIIKSHSEDKFSDNLSDPFWS